MKFWMICAWDQYYPLGGINNIKLVVTGSYEDAQKALEDYKANVKYGKDYYEIFSSDELPWE